MTKVPRPARSTGGHRGGCLCGAVRFEATAPVKAHSCSCKMCQRHSGALTTSWAWFEKGAVRWTGPGGAPTRYRSSAKWYRCFCPRCGSSLGAVGVDGTMALLLGAFDRLTGEALKPSRHFYRARHPRWWSAGVAAGVA